MKTEYKYIHFEKFKDLEKTTVWDCFNSNHKFILGVVKWHGAWMQYCFFPTPETVFNKGCLEDINHFIGQLTDQRKDKP